MSKEMITDRIGEEYKDWSYGDCIFISSPTGSGKTYFILNILLPFFSTKNQKILYLVNRRILKDQVEEKILNMPSEYEKAIRVETYQNIERRICYGECNENRACKYYGFEKVKEYEEYDCVVCDECHYFLVDSNYNTNTALSFRFVQEKYINKMRIFISATIADIQSYIQQDNIKRLNRYTFHYCLSPNPEYGSIYVSPRVYTLPSNYKYIKPTIISNSSEIAGIINEEKGKWLVFVDSIDLGKKLEKELNEKFDKQKLEEVEKELSAEPKSGEGQEADVKRRAKSIIETVQEDGKRVIMLSSDYRQYGESEDEVKKIKKEQKQAAQILISTSVMDNGISLEDIELRNIILLADTEVEFIQMLGRKREDEQELSLYIYKLTKEHFIRRKKYVEEALKIARDYKRNIEQYLNSYPIDKIGFFYSKIDWDKYEKLEGEIIKKQHVKLMRSIADNKFGYRYAFSVLNVYAGTLYLNYLAAQNLENLNLYYQRIIDRFDKEGEDAFVREQLGWLGKSGEADDIIKMSKMRRQQKALNRFVERISTDKMDWMESEVYKVFMNKMSDDLRCILTLAIGKVGEKEEVDVGDNKTTTYSTVEGAIKRTSSHVTEVHLRFMNKYCGFPFKLESRKSEEKRTQYRFVYLGESEES